MEEDFRFQYEQVSYDQGQSVDAAYQAAGAPPGGVKAWFESLPLYEQEIAMGLSAGDPNATGDGQYVPGGTSTGGGGGKSGSSTTAPSGAGDDPYYAVEENRRARGGQAPPRQGDPAPAADAAPAATGEAPTYDDDGMASDSGGGGGSSRRRSSSSGGGGGGGGSTGTGASAPAQPAFPGGGFGTPNAYPTLPMTPIRQQILNNLAGTFPNAGRFRTPPGGWREDMAPMFTTGAFGGANAAPAADPAAAPSGGNPFTMGGAGIPGGPPPSMPAMPQMAPAGDPMLPTLPDPNAIPPELAMGLAPQAPAPQQGMGTGMPAFSQPGFVAPGSPFDMQMQRARQQQAGGNAAPLPPSLRQRFGL